MAFVSRKYQILLNTLKSSKYQGYPLKWMSSNNYLQDKIINSNRRRSIKLNLLILLNNSIDIMFSLPKSTSMKT